MTDRISIKQLREAATRLVGDTDGGYYGASKDDGDLGVYAGQGLLALVKAVEAGRSMHHYWTGNNDFDEFEWEKVIHSLGEALARFDFDDTEKV